MKGIQRGLSFLDKLSLAAHPAPHSAPASPSLPGLSLCVLRCGWRVSSPHCSSHRLSAWTTECRAALRHPLAPAPFIDDTATRLMNSRCGFYRLKTLTPIRIAPTNPFLRCCWITDGKAVSPSFALSACDLQNPGSLECWLRATHTP